MKGDIVLTLIFTQFVAAALPGANPPISAPVGGVGGVAESIEIGSVLDFVIKGGPVMIPIGLCSLIALTIVIERLVSLRRSVIIPPSFLNGLKQAMGAGDARKGLEYCKAHPSPVANVFAAGIKRIGESEEVMSKHIQEAGERETLRMRKFLRALSVIASIAPLLGLLGTIFGMITAFQTVAASGEALGRTELLAKGIYEAMITTAAGLIVAIPVVVSYHWLSSKIDNLVIRIDRMTMEFIDEFAAQHAKLLAGVTRAEMDVLKGRTATPAASPDKPNGHIGHAPGGAVESAPHSAGVKSA